MKDDDNKTFRSVLGSQLRSLREKAEVRQEVLALIARRWGLPWYPNTVAQVENGRRHLTVEEWILLPTVLSEAFGRRDKPLKWQDLIPPHLSGMIAIMPDTRAYSQAVVQLLESSGVINPDLRSSFDSPQTRNLQSLYEMKLSQGTAARFEDVITEVDRKAARKLNTTPKAIVEAAWGRWGRSLMEEREHRLVSESRERNTFTPRRVQAARGVITRSLLQELQPVLKTSRSRSRANNVHPKTVKGLRE